MKRKPVIALLASVAVVSACAAAGCSNDDALPSIVVNGGFETGDLSGWTVEYGDAYDDDSVSSRKTFSYSADVDPHGYVIPVNHTGNWYLSGKGFDNRRSTTCTGAIRSDDFVLGGDGIISMKLAGGAQATSRSAEQQKPASQVCYVGIYRASDDKMIASQTNRYFAEDASNIELDDYLNGTCYTDNFCQYKIDLEEYIGETLYIRIVDNDTSYYYGYLSVDDIRIGKDGEAQPQGAYFTKTATPASDGEGSVYEVKNGGFETGNLYGWEIVEGLAFSDDGVNSDPYWWAEQIPYEREGNFHYGYYDPTAVGRMRSSVFTVGGTGYVTYKLGGCSDNERAYLRFMKVNDGGEDEEVLRTSNFAFKNMQFPYVPNGMRLINLTQYRLKLPESCTGCKMYIEVVDENPSSAMEGCVVLDGVKTYYETVPTFTDWFDVEYEIKEEIPENEFQVVNGGFENGLDGWILQGDIGVVTDDMSWWGERLPYNKSGRYHFSGMCYERNENNRPMYDRVRSYEGGTGSLTSSAFTVGGRGIMTFKLGGAYDPRFVWVSLLTEDGREVARYSNYLFADRGLDRINSGTNLANMVTYRADISEWLGQRLRIRITDNATSNWGLFTCDSFVTYYTDNDIDRFPSKTFEAVNLLENAVRPSSEYQIVNGNFETGNLDGWELNGNIGNVSYEYLWWNEWYTFNKEGLYFFNGFAGAEGDRGTLTSSPFTVGGQGIITYRLGGGMNGSLCYLEVIDADNPDTVYYRFYNERFSKIGGVFTGVPVTVGCEGFGANMVMYKADISRLSGRKVKLRLVDNATSDWGLIFADDFITYYAEGEALPSTAYEATNSLSAPSFENIERSLNFAYGQNSVAIRAANENADYTYSVRLSEENAEYTFENFVLTIIPTEQLDLNFNKVYEISFTVNELNLETREEREYTFIVTVNATYDNRLILNGDFESGDLTGWTVTDGNVKTDSAVSGEQTFWNEGLSYNQGGNFHFDGWSAQYSESETYSLQSSVFTLSGSGFISFKMGGRAAMLEVYEKDGTRIAVYENMAYKNVNFPHIDAGCMLATMTTFVADLHEHIGKELYIRILDGKEGEDFGIAMFDDIVTYYETAPDISANFDTLKLNPTTSSTGEESEFKLKWVKAENKINN